MATITVLRPDKSPRRVKAVVVGRFAVHRNLHEGDTFGPFWVVTHVPSGYYCGRIHAQREKALTVARALNALPVPWDFTTPDSMPMMTKRRALALLKRLKAQWA